MVDDFKSLRDGIMKALLSFEKPEGHGTGQSDKEKERVSANLARELINGLFVKAGRGKDEVIQIVAQEIGQAVALMLRQPLSELANNRKLQITLEFVPKKNGKGKATSRSGKKRSKTKAKSNR
jgi:hypothetical protein